MTDGADEAKALGLRHSRLQSSSLLRMTEASEVVKPRGPRIENGYRLRRVSQSFSEPLASVVVKPRGSGVKNGFDNGTRTRAQ